MDKNYFLNRYIRSNRTVYNRTVYRSGNLKKINKKKPSKIPALTHHCNE